MPVIVIGADTPLGAAVTDTLGGRSSERRAFVTAADAADRLRNAGFKVAIGDVSDWTHVEGAAMGAFTAVLIAEAAGDGRETAFADDPDAIVSSWIRAVAAADVRRIILIGPTRPSPGDREWAVVDPAGRPDTEVAAEVARLDEAARI
ncbi:MAG: NAD(P)H-binding protein [Acidimicrobiia bacterium]|nr:NAD(P)H-binding protein [Acidimicrobiia bacterium]